ncbi:hypothetical protein PILCRDRAFT_682592 [Piloderma croceum F 1598]|uniref:Uncharacterized protein n=1 Tax=Piloderma croceum (strain F 1598) TaxID=765440 RepID=A0A0C3ERN6_PILCF|nr:hypothetical protein PILCRDRAFT_682592 [Piloderma croceum F 1598]
MPTSLSDLGFWYRKFEDNPHAPNFLQIGRNQVVSISPSPLYTYLRRTKRRRSEQR